jgi:hypothetical protein
MSLFIYSVLPIILKESISHVEQMSFLIFVIVGLPCHLLFESIHA